MKGRNTKSKPILWGLLVAGILLVALIVGLWANRSVAVAAPGSPQNMVRGPLPVETMRLGKIRPSDSRQMFAGVLAARLQSRLSFERGGRIVSLIVEEGDVVQTGQVLAQLDTTDLDAQTKRTKAELTAAEAVLAERIAGPRPQEILAAKSRLASLQAKLKLAKANLKREQKLTLQNAGSRQTYDRAIFEAESNLQEIAEARATLDQLQEGTRPEKILAQRAIRDSMKARLEEIEVRRDDSVIKAPFAGTISRRALDPGTVVSTGTTVLELMSDALEGRFGLPVHVAAKRSKGQPVRIVVMSEHRDGVIVRLEPQVDAATRTRAVYVALGSEAESIASPPVLDSWVAGQVASLWIPETDSARDRDVGFWVPSSALNRGGRGIWTLMVAVGNETQTSIEMRAVEVLRTQGDYSRVRGMVQADERIVTSGLHRMTPGMTVQTKAADSTIGAATSAVKIRSGMDR